MKQKRAHILVTGFLVILMAGLTAWVVTATSAGPGQTFSAFNPVVLGEVQGPTPLPVTPTTAPTATNTPTATPTATPTDEPTATPTDEPTATPTETPTPTPTEEPSSTPAPTLMPPDPAREALVYELNREVTKKDRGFPFTQPPLASGNGDWTTPIDFVGGQIQVRITIRSMPTNKDMLLQVCYWQDDFAREECGRARATSYQGEEVNATYSQAVSNLTLVMEPIDWTRPRQRVSLVVKNSAGLPVSDYNGWNWYGENPDEWYPMDVRTTVVVVEAGRRFSGWANYP